jgi:hypothetical protein
LTTNPRALPRARGLCVAPEGARHTTHLLCLQRLQRLRNLTFLLRVEVKMLKSVIKAAVHATGFMLIRREDTPYNQEGLSTFHNSEFINDPRFLVAYQRGVTGTPGQKARQSPWRLHVAMWAAQTAMRRDGDFVECGVYLGFVSSLIMSFVGWNEIQHSKRFLLIDS